MMNEWMDANLFTLFNLFVAQYHQTHITKPKKMRPSTSRYAALTERGLDVKAAFFPDSSPLPPGALVESDDL